MMPNDGIKRKTLVTSLPKDDDDDELTWFCQKSDVFPKEFFVEFTKDCPTKDKCCMSGRSMGSTMGGVAHHYDSKGQLHVWDKNRQKVNIVCNECWKAGIVSNREDSDVYEIEIIEEAEEHG